MNNFKLSVAWEQFFEGVLGRLSEERLLALAHIISVREDVFPIDPSALRDALGLSVLESGQLKREIDHVYREIQDRNKLVGAIQILSQARRRDSSREKIEIVCTSPSRPDAPVRSTLASALQMVSSAQKRIYVVGYVFTDGAKKLIDEICLAKDRHGIPVVFIGNRIERHLPFIKSAWRPGIPAPDIYTRPADPDDEMAALHAKVLVCDDVAILGSANFSYHGLSGNIEIGVKIPSSAVSRLMEFIHEIIANQEVKRVRW